MGLAFFILKSTSEPLKHTFSRYQFLLKLFPLSAFQELFPDDYPGKWQYIYPWKILNWVKSYLSFYPGYFKIVLQYVLIISTHLLKKMLNVLPLFRNGTARQLFIDFTPFFRKIGQFLNFRNEIYKT